MGLTTDRMLRFMNEQGSMGRTITDTIRAYGLDVCPEHREGEENEDLTSDEQMLSDMAMAGIVVAMRIAPNSGPQGVCLQGLLMGLAMGYAQGLEDAITPEPVGDTFPEDWNPNA